MGNILVFLNGNLSKFNISHPLLKNPDLIICADGGAELAQSAGFTPDVMIGDFDSLGVDLRKKLENNKKIPWHPYPSEKDFTDSQLALEFALKQNPKEIVILGVLGDRLDHFIANLNYLAIICKSNDTKITILSDNQEARFFQSKTKFGGKPGDLVSLVPLDDNCRGVTTTGLQYELTDANLPLGTTRGVSNVMETNIAEISMTRGICLAIWTEV